MPATASHTLPINSHLGTRISGIYSSIKRHTSKPARPYVVLNCLNMTSGFSRFTATFRTLPGGMPITPGNASSAAIFIFAFPRVSRRDFLRFFTFPG